MITLFKPQFILAERECSTNWGDCKPNKSNQIIKTNKSYILNQIKLNVGKPEYPEKNLSEQSREPTTNDTGSRNRTRDILMGGEHSHHCAIPAPRFGDWNELETWEYFKLINCSNVDQFVQNKSSTKPINVLTGC